MLTSSERNLLSIIRAALHNEKSDISMSKEVISLAQKHSVLSICYIGTHSSEIKKNFVIEAVKSLTQMYAATELEEKFEKAELDIVIFKGVCTKRRYIDPVMRSMGDIDFLIRPKQSTQAIEQLLALGYHSRVEGRKHDIFYKPPYLCLELHRDLVDGDSQFYHYYHNIWDKLKLKGGFNHVFEMKLEDEYILNLLHLTEHFIHGGIGVRFLVDVYVYEQLELNREYLQKELKKLNLDKFYDKLCSLVEYWFGTGKATSDLLRLESYVFSGGTFGSSENAKNSNAGRGKIKSFLRSIFPGFSSMKSMYPWLIPIFLPIGWLLRGFSAILYRRKHIHYLFDSSLTGDREKGRELMCFFDECGLRL